MSQLVKVNREKIIACMTCPLCNNLLKQATTISLCLHTFCRKCICEKFSDDDVDTCPVCDTNLGCVPVDKLRPDHNLQDIRSKIFPLKRRKVEAPEVAPSVSPPTKRKERSLSSLVVATPKVSDEAGATGRRTRSGARKSSVPRSASQSREGTPKKDEDPMDDEESSSSPETLYEIMQNKKQSSAVKLSNDHNSGEDVGNNQDGWDGKVDLWKPLNTLVEAANRSKSSKSVSQRQSPVKSDQSKSGDPSTSLTKVKPEDNGVRTDIQDDNTIMPLVPGPVKRKRVHPYNKTQACAESSNSVIMLSEARRNWRDGQVWFSLVASRDQEGGEPLPQVSSAFLRVKNGNMPISYIQKYLVKKLHLTNETEAQDWFNYYNTFNSKFIVSSSFNRGDDWPLVSSHVHVYSDPSSKPIQLMWQRQQVMPHLKLSNLLDQCVQSSSNTKRIKTYVGNSGKEFVIVLSYSRKVAAPAS